MLKSENEIAMRRVRTPAIRAAYARVPMRWMMNVRIQMMRSWVSMVDHPKADEKTSLR